MMRPVNEFMKLSDLSAMSSARNVADARSLDVGHALTQRHSPSRP